MKTRLNSFTVNFDNSVEFHVLKREIFGNHQYYFETDNPTPVIVDIGSHIGLSILYFKQIYPQASIKGYEPIPENFRLLQENIFLNNLSHVEVFNVAVAETKGKIDLFMDETTDKWYSTAGIHLGAWTGTQKSKRLTVDAVTLNDAVDSPTDLLKMDIEGLEQVVLTKSEQVLSKVQRIFVEYHPVVGQDINTLTTFLENLNFKVKLEHQSFGLILIKATK